MKNPWKTLRRAMGKDPSPSSRFRGLRPLTYEELASGLSTLEVDPAPLTDERILHIERKIFSALGEAPPISPSKPVGRQPTLEGPVPASYLKDLALKTRDDPENLSLEFHSLGEVAPPFDLTELLSSIDSQAHEALDLSEVDTAKPKRLIRKTVAAFTAAYLLAGTAALASQNALPGDLLYPVRLQVEAVRLSLAGSDLAKAERHIAVASARLAALSDPSMSSSRVSVLAGEMDANGLDALKLLKLAEASPERGDLLGRLLGLAYSEQRTLQRLMDSSSITVFGPVSRSYSTAVFIAAEASKLLLFTGRSPVIPVVNAPSLPEDLASDSSSTFEIRNSRPRQSPAPRTSIGEPTQSKDPAELGPGDDDDTPCSLASGDVCIVLPPLPSLP